MKKTDLKSSVASDVGGKIIIKQIKSRTIEDKISALLGKNAEIFYFEFEIIKNGKRDY